jgi:hypothetical protein
MAVRVAGGGCGRKSPDLCEEHGFQNGLSEAGVSAGGVSVEGCAIVHIAPAMSLFTEEGEICLLL